MKKANNSFDEIMEWVLSAETIALAGHTNPDGDAIGACLALGGALEKAGKQVQVILEKYADKYQLIPNGHLVCAAEDARLPELFLVLDCGDEGRLGDAAEIFQKAAKKIKLTLKKVKRAKGYQIAVYKTKKSAKKNKKAIVKRIVKKRKVTIRSKKLKNKKTLYVKVRAYVVNDKGKKIYGKWSKKRKVKIRN